MKKITSGFRGKFEQGEVENLNKKVLFSAARVAEWLGVSERWVRQLTADGVLHCEGRTKLYDMQRAVQEYIGHLKAGKNETVNVDFNAEKALLMQAKRKSVEMDMRRRERELIEADEIRDAMRDMLVAFRARVRAIPAKVSPRVAGMEDRTKIFDIIRAECDEALMELSDFDTVFGGKEDMDAGEDEEGTAGDSEDAGTAAGDDGI